MWHVCQSQATNAELAAKKTQLPGTTVHLYRQRLQDDIIFCNVLLVQKITCKVFEKVRELPINGLNPQ